MHECSKALRRRLCDPAFLNRYLRGDGLEIIFEDDHLGEHAGHFPLIRNIKTIDSRHHNAEALAGLAPGSFDFVHCGHILVRLADPAAALRRWVELLREDGHLIFTVPDEDLYEQGVFPSTFNSNHLWTATIYKARSWSPRSFNVLDLVRDLGSEVEIVKIEQCHQTFRRDLSRRDQTLGPLAECTIEVVLRKRPRAEAAAGGRREADIPIYGARHPEFGDCWSMISELLEESRETGHEIQISRYSTEGEDLKGQFESILGVLQLRGGRVRIVDARRNQERFFSVFTNKRPYAHTKVRWSRAKAKPQGCFQLESRRYEDGKYGEIKPNYNNPFRLLSQEALEQIYALFAALPYPMVHIGQHLGLAGSIKVASESRFFIGIDSGMSHLCHSIGVPVYLYEGRPTELTVHDLHPGKAFKTFANIEDVAAILKRHT